MRYIALRIATVNTKGVKLHDFAGIILVQTTVLRSFYLALKGALHCAVLYVFHHLVYHGIPHLCKLLLSILHVLRVHRALVVIKVSEHGG